LLQLDPPVREPIPARDHVVSIRVPGESLDKARFEPLTIRFTEQEARDAVSDAVFDELSTHCASGTLLTGLSGGGDSNAMAPGIQKWQQNSPRTRKVVVFTLEFEAIWPSAGTSRARQLCAKYGFTHLVIDAAAMTQLLDLRTSVGEFYFDWVEHAGMNTSHGFATYLIAAVARRWLDDNCASGESKYFALGYNREDILGEVLFSVINGKSPLAYPTRSFGDKTLVMPTWRLPKALLDACFGHFSAENYSERIDRTVRSRGLTHYLAHQLDSSYPGFGMSLLEGVRQTFQGKFACLTEQNFDLWVSEHASPEARITMENICRKHIRS
jgi:hypothetical protein